MMVGSHALEAIHNCCVMKPAEVCFLLKAGIFPQPVSSGRRDLNENGLSPCYGAFCTKCSFGAQALNMLREKASLHEGHGFSRAVKRPSNDGFSR
jgi:hypothetical protein